MKEVNAPVSIKALTGKSSSMLINRCGALIGLVVSKGKFSQYCGSSSSPSS